MLLITDVLLITMGVFVGAGVVPALAGEAPIEFMGATPWTETGAMAAGAVVSGVVWTVLFHPALLVVAGGFVGASFMASVAEVDPQAYMDDPHPSRMAVYAFAAGGLTLLAWLVV